MNGHPPNDTTARVAIVVNGLREIAASAERLSDACRQFVAIAWHADHFEPYRSKPGEAVARGFRFVAFVDADEPWGTRLPRPRFPVGFT